MNLYCWTLISSFRPFLLLGKISTPTLPFVMWFLSVCRRKKKYRILGYWLADKMLAFFQRILDWIKSLFWKEEMELTLVGLQYSGKTTFVNVIAVSDYLRLLCFVLNFNYQSSLACFLHTCFTFLLDFKNRKFFFTFLKGKEV